MPAGRLFLALLLLGTCVPALRADEAPLPDLAARYEAHLADRAQASYEAQRAVLADIAARRTPAARRLLERLLAQYGRADRRRTVLLLQALVRHGSPKDLDGVVDWVEDRKDRMLLGLLHQVVAAVEHPATRAHLREGALHGATPPVKVEILRALGTLRDREALPAVLELVRSHNLLVRIEAVETLGRLRVPQALPVLQALLHDEDVHVRDAAARGLGYLGASRAVPALARALGDEATLVVESAATALGRIGDPAAVPHLIDGLARVRGKDLRLEDAYVQALQAISGKAIAPDPDLWRSWWETVKDLDPFPRADERPGRRTVGGPHYYGFPVRSSRVVFVLDVSRSMGWNERLVRAKKELVQVLGHLPRATKFNLIVYSDEARRWKPRLTEASRSNVRRAIRFVEAQEPLTGTNTHGALALAFDDAEADTIFFLSDGHPSVGRVTDPDLILGQVRSWNRLRRVRIHGIALLRGRPPAAFQSLEDPDRSAAFMRRLAEQNQGRFEVVR